MLIDTHAHLDFEDYNEDRDEVIKRAFENGIEKIINVGCSLERSKTSIELAEKYENVFATVGLHPDEIRSLDVSDLKYELENLIKSSKKVVAIGECGLDYSRIKLDQEKDKQKELFKLHLDLAQDLDLPLVIHVRDIFDDALNVLKNYEGLRGVMHCFGGSVKEAKKVLEAGFLISFTGIVTFKNAKEVQEAAKFVPLEKMMLETDCPFLAPEPNRGRRNEPAFVRDIAEKICELKEVSMEEVERVTTENAENMFRL